MKIKALALVILSYMSTYLTPVIAAFFILADGAWKGEQKWNLIFLLFVMIVFIAFAIKVATVVNKQKANHFKTLFQGGIFMGFMWLIMGIIDYMTFNMLQIQQVLWITVLGYAGGMLFKTLAIQKYKDFIRELGVF
jgi:ABC-type uncharacterized transport system fused permease/ATPase subunit